MSSYFYTPWSVFDYGKSSLRSPLRVTFNRSAMDFAEAELHVDMHHAPMRSACQAQDYRLSPQVESEADVWTMIAWQGGGNKQWANGIATSAYPSGRYHVEVMESIERGGGGIRLSNRGVFRCARSLLLELSQRVSQKLLAIVPER